MSWLATRPIRYGKNAPPTTPIEIYDEACCVWAPNPFRPRLKMVGNMMLKKKLSISRAINEGPLS